jgi:hypothetical protein
MREIPPLAADNSVLRLKYLIFYGVELKTNHNTNIALCQIRYINI